MLRLELGDEPLDDALVEIVAAKVCVAVGRLNFDYALADFEDGNIECAAAKVVDSDGLVLLFVEAIGQSRRGGLVDDAFHIKSGNSARILGGLALRVVEVGRHSNHSLSNRLTQIGFSALLELLQDHCGDFGRS